MDPLDLKGLAWRDNDLIFRRPKGTQPLILKAKSKEIKVYMTRYLDDQMV